MKLPAYGKPLLLRRRAGDHPLEVALVFGHQWRADVGRMPLLALNPEDYAPGVYDFGCVAGLRVLVHDQDMAAADCDENVLPPTFGVFYDLLGELARLAARVEIVWPAKSGWQPVDARELAREWRWMDRARPAGDRMQWPRWWSDALDDDYERRWYEWESYTAAMLKFLGDKRAEAA